VKEYLGGAQVTDDELVNILYVMNQVRDLTTKKLGSNPSDDTLVQMNSIATENLKTLMGYIANRDPGGYDRFTTVMSKMIKISEGSSQEQHGG
jgi:hypothetical protein